MCIGLLLECGFSTALIGHFKGYNFWGWLLLGLVFGVFALVVIAAIPQNREPTCCCSTLAA